MLAPPLPPNAAITTRLPPFRPPPPPPPTLKTAAGETLFRVLCPVNKTGVVIGKGGAAIRQVREETGARIRIDDSVSGCVERVILIAADSTKKTSISSQEESSSSVAEDEGSPAQQALVRVFERILKVDEERSWVSTDNETSGGSIGCDGGGTPQGPVVVRLLAPSNQVGSVLGKGGKIVERIRHDRGTQLKLGFCPRIRFPTVHIPAMR